MCRENCAIRPVADSQKGEDRAAQVVADRGAKLKMSGQLPDLG
jgi:hypothetical protein